MIWLRPGAPRVLVAVSAAVLLGWGCVAFAQGIDPYPQSPAPHNTVAGPGIVLDLNAMTWPGVLGLIAFLFRDGFPFTVQIHHIHTHRKKGDSLDAFDEDPTNPFIRPRK